MFKAELQAWKRVRPVLVMSRDNVATLEIQEEERQLNKYEQATLKWNMSDGGVTKDRS